MKITQLKFSLLFFTVLTSNLAFAQLPKNYQSLTADQKQSVLWSNISQNPYKELPSLGNSVLKSVLGSINSVNLTPTIETVSDEMPMVGLPFLKHPRVKFIHASGTCGQIEFVPSPEASQKATGVFASGSIGVARLGWAMPPQLGTYIPGLAVKFLINGHPSVNLQVMNSLDGQGQNANYFAKTFSNLINEPVNPVTKALSNLFKLATSNPFYLPVHHVAKIESNGQKVQNPIVPEVLQFVPVQTQFIAENSTQDLRLKLTQMPIGSELYQVYGITQSEKTRLGSLFLRSEFVNSEYCDKYLFFQHHTVESAQKN